ncbi:MAG: cytidylate kinase family protein, partial [bacterium]
HSRRGFIQQTVEVLFGHRPTEYQAYETLVESLVTLAEAGRVILVGRGGAIVCGELARGVHVRLIAPLHWRAEKIAREREISPAEAEAIASRQGKGRMGFVRDFTGKDVFDPLNYDFVFNNERNGVDLIADMTMSAIRHRELVRTRRGEKLRWPNANK